MTIFEYKNFVRKLANELRGSSSEEISRRLEQLKVDVKREIAFGNSMRK